MLCQAIAKKEIQSQKNWFKEKASLSRTNFLRKFSVRNRKVNRLIIILMMRLISRVLLRKLLYQLFQDKLLWRFYIRPLLVPFYHQKLIETCSKRFARELLRGLISSMSGLFESVEDQQMRIDVEPFQENEKRTTKLLDTEQREFISAHSLIRRNANFWNFLITK